MEDEESLAWAFADLGVEIGDTLLVHSSYKSLGGVNGGPLAVLRAFRRALGDLGTLVVPTFNFDFCNGSAYDVRRTPSRMGVLTEIIRADPASRGIPHPIHSFAVSGARADELGRIRNRSSFGHDSLFAKLRALNGKIMIVGLNYNNSMTFLHHIEEMEGCDYRLLKAFRGTVVSYDDIAREETYYMNVRDTSRGVVTDVEPVGKLLEHEGFVQIRRIGSADVKLMRAREVYAFAAPLVRERPELFHRRVAPSQPRGAWST